MRLLELNSNKYHIYVDLDGVMADLQSRVEEILGRSITTTPGGTDWDDSDAIWKELRSMGEPDFSTLNKLPDADALWDYVKKYTPDILTATGQPEKENAAQKREWVRKNLDGYNKIYTVVGSRMKARYADPSSVLIDDRLKSIKPWREAGGIGILHTSAADTIRQLKKLGL